MFPQIGRQCFLDNTQIIFKLPSVTLIISKQKDQLERPGTAWSDSHKTKYQHNSAKNKEKMPQQDRTDSYIAQTEGYITISSTEGHRNPKQSPLC